MEEAIKQIKDLEKIIYSHKKTFTDDQLAPFLTTQIMVYTETKQYDKAASSAKEYIQNFKKASVD